MKKRLIQITLVIIAVIFVFASCGTGAVEDGTLVVAIPSFPVSLDVSMTNEFNASLVNRNWIETLVKFDGPDWNIVPGLAESWHFVDPQTLVLNLRRGVRFHNGDEMTANDAALSIMRSVHSPPVRFILNSIDSIDVIDDFTLQINMLFPFVPILSHLTHPSAGVISERARQELGADFANQPVGTGPFKFSSMSLGDYVELVRNENYWGPAPGVERIRFVVIPEGTNRLIEVETGQAHIAFDISPHHLPRLQTDPALAYDRAAVPRYHFLGFNFESPVEALRDVRVRRAITHAIDVQAIANTVYQGLGRLTHGPLVGIPGVIDLPHLEFDLDRARQLMAEAGYADGFSVTLWNTSDNQQEADTAVILQNMLAQINIDVQIVSVEFATFLHGVTQGQQDMHVLSWNNITGDLDYGLTLYHSSNIGASNRFRYNNPEVDRLLNLGRQELDHERRLEIYAEIQRIIHYDAVAVFLLHGEELVATSPSIRGFVNFPMRSPRLNTVQFVN